MAEGSDKMLGKHDKSLSLFDTRRGAVLGEKSAADMDDAMRAQCLLHEAFPDLTHEGKGRVERALDDAWRFLRPKVEPRIHRPFTARRVRALHEGRAKRIDGAEIDALELAKIEEARRERQRIRQRLECLERMLAEVDADLAGTSPAALGRPADGQGRAAAR